MNHPTLSNNKITTVEGATAVAAVIAGVLVVVLIVSAVVVAASVVEIAVTKQQQRLQCQRPTHLGSEPR